MMGLYSNLQHDRESEDNNFAESSGCISEYMFEKMFGIPHILLHTDKTYCNCPTYFCSLDTLHSGCYWLVSIETFSQA